jgi:hypothetical protein
MDSRKNQLKASTNFLQIAHHITNELSFNNKAESRNSALLLRMRILKSKKKQANNTLSRGSCRNLLRFQIDLSLLEKHPQYYIKKNIKHCSPYNTSQKYLTTL